MHLAFDKPIKNVLVHDYNGLREVYVPRLTWLVAVWNVLINSQQQFSANELSAK